MHINLETQNISPVLVLAYKRYDMLRDLLSLLPSNRKIFIHIDGPTNETRAEVEKARYLANNFKKARNDYQVKTLIQENNLGNIKSFQAAMEWLFTYEKKVIFLEEDIRFNINFFSYMDWALENFQSDKRIFQINGLSVLDIFPIRNQLFETYSCKPWGFGTWIDRWETYKRTSIPMNSEEIFQAPIFHGINLTSSFKYKWVDRFDRLKSGNDTYDLGWNYAAWANNSCAISQLRTLTTNIGFDGRSLHTKIKPRFLRSPEKLYYRRFGKKNLKLIPFPSSFDSVSDLIEWKVPGISHGAAIFFILIYNFLKKLKTFIKKIESFFE